MVIRVPENKKITECEKLSFMPLNESFFDDYDNGKAGDDVTASDLSMEAVGKKFEEIEIIPRVKAFLNQLDVHNYTVECTGHGVVVDVHDHLYLPNRGLREFSSFSFGRVDGDCDFAGNRFDDFKWFPRYIGGDCIANFNRIRDFQHAPTVMGRVFAQRQRVKTLYPLTDETYRKYISGELDEWLVVDVSDGAAGLLTGVSPDSMTCVAEMFDGTVREIPADRAECELDILDNI